MSASHATKRNASPVENPVSAPNANTWPYMASAFHDVLMDSTLGMDFVKKTGDAGTLCTMASVSSLVLMEHTEKPPPAIPVIVHNVRGVPDPVMKTVRNVDMCPLKGSVWPCVLTHGQI